MTINNKSNKIKIFKGYQVPVLLDALYTAIDFCSTSFDTEDKTNTQNLLSDITTLVNNITPKS